MPRIVDLSVTIENNMPAHKNMPRPVYLPWMTHESCRALNQGVPGDPFTTPIEYIGMLNHVGTHVDAFYHLKPGGQTRLPERMVGPATRAVDASTEILSFFNLDR